MWPVDSLTPLLSEDLLAFEDTEFVELRCSRCGWTAVYSATGVRTDTLILDARAHTHASDPGLLQVGDHVQTPLGPGVLIGEAVYDLAAHGWVWKGRQLDHGPFVGPSR